MNREELLAALARHGASGPAEERSLARIRGFLEAPADPFSRANPEGHVTGSAVVARPEGSAFLLVHHRKLSRWLQPGGHTEPSDRSAFDAALREAREETGITLFEAPLGRVVLDVDVHAIPAHGKDPAHFHFDIRYLLTASGSGEPGACEDPGRPMRWMTLEEALAEGVDESLVRALEKARFHLADGLAIRRSEAGTPSPRR